MAQTKNNYIKFLGTAGARFVVARQLRSSAGIWMNVEGDNILIDPGPGTLVKCFSSRPKLAQLRQLKFFSSNFAV